MPGSRPHQGKEERPRWIRKPLSASSRADFPIVAIGASAGGLDACKKLLDALPADNGMAFIIVQHLDPTHDSMMVGFARGPHGDAGLASDRRNGDRTRARLCHPAWRLSFGRRQGALRLSRPQAPSRRATAVRFPLEFAGERIWRARRLRDPLGNRRRRQPWPKAVKAKGGLVIAQEIGEADYDGMPRSAIATGAVDLVLPRRRSPRRSSAANRARPWRRRRRKSRSQNSVQDFLPKIIDLLRTKTVHDFTLYKHGTLERRVERRMAMAAIKTADEYFDFLLRDADERDQLSRDLLINVTGFFRDAPVFDFLEKNVIPDLVRDHAADRPLRIWVAGCSSGEETYSLAMLFREQIDAAKRDIKLQVFASDVDPEAVAIAREGLYPQSIEADVSPSRLAAFFSREDRSYRVSPELRASVLFTVQDVLADPPFARLDFVSCRNLLIYLRPEAQAKVALDLPFRVARGRSAAGRQRRDSGSRRRPICRRFQIRAPLSARWRQPARRPRLVYERRRRAADARAPDRRRRLRAKLRLPSFVEPWCWRPMVPPRC